MSSTITVIKAGKRKEIDFLNFMHSLSKDEVGTLYKFTKNHKVYVGRNNSLEGSQAIKDEVVILLRKIKFLPLDREWLCLQCHYINVLWKGKPSSVYFWKNSVYPLDKLIK